MKRFVWMVVVGLLFAAGVAAQAGAPPVPVVDGTAEVLYGAALSVQNTRTQFGDGVGNPDPILTGTALGGNTGGGSEIDQIFATVADGRLYVTVAGNLEGNFNKLDVFFDSVAGGVNTLDGAMLPGGMDGFCCGGFPPPNGNNINNVGALQRMNGMRFDDTSLDPNATATFTADYMLIFTHGPERVNENLPNDVQFWGMTAHFADLRNGTAGQVGGLGMQLGPRGEPRLLRGPGDYNRNGRVDAADYTTWRDTLGQTVDNGTGADGNANGEIDQADYDAWKANFNRDTSITGDAYKPLGNPGNTEALLGPTLPGLGQGELIDRAYALAAGKGECDDDTGAGCAAKELEFALNVDPAETGAMPNASNHRNFNNFVDLRMALDNSNIVGVRGSGGPDFALVEGVDDPMVVRTGIEFSIPLSAIGNPTGDIRISAMVNGGNHDFLSNQVAGIGVFNLDALTGANIGGAFFGASPAGSFNDIPGNQFVTVVQAVVGGGAVAGVPEPASVAMALVGMLLGGSLVRRHA